VLGARGFAGRQKSLEMAISKNHVLKLYKTMLRESQKFSSYNYRLFIMLLLLNCIAIGKFKKNTLVWLCLLACRPVKVINEGFASDTEVMKCRLAHA
jgi:hypothetical protein